MHNIIIKIIHYWWVKNWSIFIIHFKDTIQIFLFSCTILSDSIWLKPWDKIGISLNSKAIWQFPLVSPTQVCSSLLCAWCPTNIEKKIRHIPCAFVSTAAGCGWVSPERSSYSQENCCQRGGGNITISLSVLSLFQLSKYLTFDKSSCIWSISRCRVYTVVFVCVWFQMISPLSLEQALSARDSMAKAIYGRAFTWLVQKLNQSLAFKVCSSFLLMRTVLALL